MSQRSKLNINVAHSLTSSLHRIAMPSLAQKSSRFERIVKKAKECRSNKDKLLTQTNDTSYNALQSRRKPDLSQSFIMRQTVALSAKNKQLVNALTQTKQQNADLELNIRKMQEKIMLIIIKLNSREVALDSCLQELEIAKKSLQAKDEMYTSLYNQMHMLLASVPKPSEVVESEPAAEYTPVDFSFQPKRVPKSKPSLSMTPKQQKWKPDLSIVQEKHREDSVLEVLQDVVTTSTQSPERMSSGSPDTESRASPPSQPPDVDTEYFDSASVSVSHIDEEFTRKRRARGRTSIFSISSFDPDEANLNLSENDIIDEETDGDDKPREEVEISAEALPVNENLLTTKDEEKNSVTPEDGNKENKEPHAVISKIPKRMPPISLKRKSKNFSNTSFGDPVVSTTGKSSVEPIAVAKCCESTTIFSDQPMDLTDPVAMKIVTGKPKPKKQPKEGRKPKKSKPKTHVRFKEDSAPQEKDVYNCSSDSFLINPDKKIELSKESTVGKSRSLPMSNITNEVAEIEQTRRRRRTAACLSYKEPSLGKKLRRGDKFFAKDCK